MFPVRTVYFVALFPPHTYGKKKKKSKLLLWSSGGRAKWVAWKRSQTRGMSFPSFLLLFHWPQATSFSGCDVCECVFLLATAYPACRILLLMSHITHTYIRTSQTSLTGNVCFLLQCSFCFPLKAQRRMSSTHAARLNFSLHILVNQPAVIQKRSWSGFQAIKSLAIHKKDFYKANLHQSTFWSFEEDCYYTYLNLLQ